MYSVVETSFEDIEEDEEMLAIVNQVIGMCFKEEKLSTNVLYISVILTDSKNIRRINKEYRNIDKETDVLSFPMFEKEELDVVAMNKDSVVQEVLGDIIISIPQVKKQAIEYGHDFKREFAYMIVHGFYHLMGCDHIQESDKKTMRKKEEIILEKLKLVR